VGPYYIGGGCGLLLPPSCSAAVLSACLHVRLSLPSSRGTLLSTQTPVRPSADEPNSHAHGEAWVEQLPMQRVHAQGSFFRGFWPTMVEIWQYRQLLGQLTRKELKVKYKDSVLGFLWTLIRPLLQLLVYSIAVGGFLGNGRVIPEFGVYLFTGLLCWTLFTDIIGGCTGSIVGNAGLVKKVYFPREMFPLSVIGAAAINFVLQCVVLIGAYAVNNDWPKPDNFALIPLALLVLLAFATALGLLLAASNVYLRDVQYLVEVTLLFWFWMTPIVYAWTQVQEKLHVHYNWLLQIYLANPMCDVVLAFQKALWPGGTIIKYNPDKTIRVNGPEHIFNGNLYGRLGILLAVCLVLLWLAQRVFARAQGNFAQEL
jgi:ABC-2 type transport system permease protein